MPYYNDLGLYVSPSTSTSTNLYIPGPYSNHSSIIAANFRPISSVPIRNFRTYKPHLATISENQSALRRINSPKLIYHTTPRLKAPRPVKINTADIDVSRNRYNTYEKPVAPKIEEKPKTVLSPQGSIELKEAKPNTNIKRDRPTVRIQTIHNDVLDEEKKSWRDNFDFDVKNEEEKPKKKKTPGELLKEKFLIRCKSKEDLTKKVKRVNSVKKSPSFKDICQAITTDSIDEDLNPGQPIEIKRLQSRQLSTEDIFKEIRRNSKELADEILDMLTEEDKKVEKEPESRTSVKKKKKYTKKKSSEIIDPHTPHRRSTVKKSKSNEKVRDISHVEIEKIKIKPKPIITATVDIEEKKTLKVRVDDVEVEESPKPKKVPKFKFNVIVEELPEEENKENIEEKVETIKELPRTEEIAPKKTDNVPEKKTELVDRMIEDKENKMNSVDGDEVSNEVKSEIFEPFVKNIEKQTNNLTENRKNVEKILEKSQSVESFLKEPKINKFENMKKNFEIAKSTSEKNTLQDSRFPWRKLKETKPSSLKEDSKITNELNAKKKLQHLGATFEDLSKTPKEEVPILEELKIDNIETKIENISEEKPQKIQDLIKEHKAVDNNIEAKELEPINSPAEEKKEEACVEPIVLEEIKAENSPEIEKLPDLKLSLESENRASSEKKLDIKPKKLEFSQKKSSIKSEKFENKSENLESSQNICTEPEKPSITQKKLSIKLENESSEKLDSEPAKIQISEELNSESAKSFEETKPEKKPQLKLQTKLLQETQSFDQYDPESKTDHSRLSLPETPEPKTKPTSKRSLVNKANKDDPDLVVFVPPTPPTPEEEPQSGFVPLQSNRLSQFMHPFKKPEQFDECPIEIYATPKWIRKRHYPRPRHGPAPPPPPEESSSEDEDSEDDEDEDEDEETSSEEEIEEGSGASKVGASTSSNDSGFDSAVAGSRHKDCDVNCHKKCEKLTANLCGINQKLIVEAIESVRKGSSESRDSPTSNPANNPALAIDSGETPEEYSRSSTFTAFQRSGRITPPATTIPRFRKYCVDDFNFLKVLGKGSFGKVLLAELKGTEYYYAVKCLKKDVVLEDDDVECTLIERKVLALGTKHPYLCHLLCTFQTESHLFFVMEYLNGGDLMFHIQQTGRFDEARARLYGAEIVSGLKFLHGKGIVYRDLKLDNILLDFDGHVRIADFGMCKLQIFLDRMADTFCGTPDYMAPEIIKGLHYNQCVDWWSFGVLLYEMLIGQSPFSGCDEDELFWSICNEKPVIPRFLSSDASAVLLLFLEKNASKRLGNRFCPSGEIQDQPFFKHIDWNKLEARQLEAPFRPNLQHPLDTQYFDKTFTVEKAKLTPIETNILESMDQSQFQGFSYTNPNATDK